MQDESYIFRRTLALAARIIYDQLTEEQSAGNEVIKTDNGAVSILTAQQRVIEFSHCLGLPIAVGNSRCLKDDTDGLDGPVI